jgi:hypothetical protein
VGKEGKVFCKKNTRCFLPNLRSLGKIKTGEDFFAKTERQTKRNEVQTLPTFESIFLPLAGQLVKTSTSFSLLQKRKEKRKKSINFLQH